MGQARIKEASAREIAFAKTDRCVFCGGLVQATTVDHCPPRAIFSDRKWPEGYVFPACLSCNAGSKTDENWVALLTRLHPGADDEPASSRAELERLARPLLKPWVLKSMQISANRKRELARRASLTPEPGQAFADLPLVSIPEPAQRAVPVFAEKLAKALHFMHSGRIVPAEASMQHRWFTNFNQMEGTIPQDIFTVPPGFASLRRTAVDLSDQFNYRYAMAETGDLSVFTVWFRFSFCINIALAFDPAVMNRLLAEVAARRQQP